MESNEKYINDFLFKKAELEAKGELWRLRVTQEEFLSEIQRLRKYEIDAKKNSTLNEYHIQQNIEGIISIMLMDACTFKEMKEQAKRLSEESEKDFAEEAPMIRERLILIETPLKFRDSVNIYLWIFRNQISIEMLPSKVKDEFTKTRHYEKLKNMKKI
ncbi:MAG: hypothetical protein HXX18_07675 [Bacteroidetes bacterium]|nr:hypothetical protein [Bacteroidota bacterium]